MDVDGIQVNFCKNPACSAYGVPASQIPANRKGAKRHKYSVVAAGRNFPVLKCHGCGEFPPMKSNLAIAEETNRLSDYLAEPASPGCKTPGCVNVAIGIGAGKAFYQSFGKTTSGGQRYRCKACLKTFSVSKSTAGHRLPHKNRLVFSLLMNKMPFRRICEAADINPKTLYDKMDFIHRQCLSFVGSRERKLAHGFHVDRLYVGVDRQDYVANWTRREDKRNVQLSAVGSADNLTGYVFGMHLNFDVAADNVQIEKGAIDIDDCSQSPPFRRYARAWLDCDYADAVKRSAKPIKGAFGALNAEIDAVYAAAIQREDIEVAERPERTSRLPAKGIQVHSEYTLYGHFFMLRKLFGGVEKVRFFLDQDSGMRAACLGAFQPEIAARQCDAFYVRIKKELTVDEKKKVLATSRAVYRQAQSENPGLDDADLRLLLVKRAMANMSEHGKWKDRWLEHPFPNMGEPGKAICYLTDYGDYDEDHRAWLYNKASLHSIDCFFMQVRRRLSLLERPFSSASAARRVWHGYSAYNPESIVKLLDIFRVYYNYCLKGKDGNTPAMRLGLAKGVVTLEDLIYFAG